LQLSRQSGRLAVASRCHQKHQPSARQRIAELLFELAAFDQAAAETRGLDLGSGETGGLHEDAEL
jgi:hypothetical protein